MAWLDCRNEADLKFEFAFQLRLRKIKFRLEHSFQDCRFDLVIGANGKVTDIIEFKRIDHFGGGRPSKHSKQKNKYSKFKTIKLHWVFSKKSFKKTLFELSGDKNIIDIRNKNFEVFSIE